MSLKRIATAALAAAMMAGTAGAQDDPVAKLRQAYAKAGDWLVSQQEAAGSWKMGPEGKAQSSVAATALIIGGFSKAPPDLRAKYADSVKRGTAFVLSKKNGDGSFGEGPSGTFMKTYTTAVALQGLAALEMTDAVSDAIRGAQAYLKQNQLKEGPMAGGLGYGDAPKPGPDGKLPAARADLSVAGFAAESLKDSGLPQTDDFWKLVVQFARKCQNNSEINQDADFIAALKKEGMSVGDDGGLFYAPVADKKGGAAGLRKVADKQVIGSYGAMTYDGIKTYLYAGLPKDSPEVRSAVDWVRKNWSLDAHAGFPFDEQKRNHLRGLYYYYLLMSRALDAYGENPFETFDGKKHDWPREMAAQLAKSVKDDRMWINENPAFYESDPVLVTSYVLLTCNVLFRNAK